MWQLTRTRPILVIGFLVAALATTFFGGRIIVRAIYWSDPAHHNQAVEGWMTAGYIGRSWGVDPFELDAQAGLPLPSVKGRPQPLSEIAQDRGVPVAQVIADVEAALQILASKKNGPDK